MNKNEIFISGYAKLPSNITASKLYEVIAVGLIVNKEDGTIKDSDCSLATSMAIDYVKGLLIGENINEFDLIEKKINAHYYGSAKKSLISALFNCKRKYEEIIDCITK